MNDRHMIGDKGEGLVFLLSMPRSGSTLLSLMLGAHSKVQCPPEPWIVLTTADYLNLANLRDLPYGRSISEIATLEFMLNTSKRDRDRIITGPRKFISQCESDNFTFAQNFLREIYQSSLDISGKSIFIDKTPRYYAALDLISELFPKSKKITLFRNPLDIYASYKTAWEIGEEIFTPAGASVHSRDFCDGLFKLSAYASQKNNNCLALSYEDLITNTVPTLQSVCDFIGVSYSHKMLKYYQNTILIDDYAKSYVGDALSAPHVKFIDKNSMNAWPKKLNHSELQAAIDVLGKDIFNTLGYGASIDVLKSMGIDIPSNSQVTNSRKILMQSLRSLPSEEPFSTWKNFVFPLKAANADRAARLEVIHQQQDEMGLLRESLAASEADRAARLEVIHQQQDEIRDLQSFSGFIQFKYNSVKKR